jgi:SAM-dependent methyltransferase
MKAQYAKKYGIVADLYDTYIDYEDDIPFWVNQALRAGEVLELTAGTGRVTLPLARAGINVTAVDASGDMLRILREKARREKLRIEIHRADIRKFSLHRRFPLVIIPFNSISEILDGDDRKIVLARVKHHLKKDGRLILTARNFDFSRVNLPSKMPPKEHVHPGTGRRVRFWSDNKINRRTHTGTSYQHYEELGQSGNVVRKRLFKNRYHVFDRRELEALIDTAGFRIAHTYGDYLCSPLSDQSPFMIYELV